jgi:integrase
MTEGQPSLETTNDFQTTNPACQRPTIGFREAANLYARSGGEDFYLKPLIEYFGNTPLEDVDQAAVDNAALALKPDAAPSTRCRQVHTPASAIIRYCANLGLCRSLRLRRPKSISTRDRCPSAEEAKRLILACSPHIRPLVLLLFEGARPGEVLRSDWNRIDLDRGFVVVRRKRSPRVLRIHERTVEALKKLPHRKGRVFRTPSGRDYVSQRPSIKTAFKGACRRAGIRDLSPRDCSRAGYPFNDRPKNGA